MKRPNILCCRILNLSGALIISFLLPLSGNTQDTLKNDIYQVWLGGPGIRASGYLHRLSDSTLTVSNSFRKTSPNLKEYKVEQVQWVKFRDRHSILRGAGWGAVLGFAFGFFTGIVQGDSPTCDGGGICVRLTAFQKGLYSSLITTPIGAITGGILGSFKTKITFGGSRSGYARQREELEKYRLGN